MSTTIRIGDEIYAEAAKTAKAECRTIPSQIEYWAKIGKAALDNPDLPIEFVKDLVITLGQNRSLAERFIAESHHD